MKNNPQFSYWEKSLMPSECDVCIVGGGFTGAWTAHYLSQMAPGLKIVILENQIASRGASTRNAGFLCYGSPSEVLEDMENMGTAKTRELILMRYSGLQQIKNTIPASAAQISWDGGCEIFTQDNPTLYERVMEQLEGINRLIESTTGQSPYTPLPNDQLPGGGKNGSKGIAIQGEGQIQPAKLLAYINNLNDSRGVSLCEGTAVNSIQNEDEHSVINTNRSLRIRSKKVLIATNGFFNRLYPGSNEVVPARNTVLLLKTPENFTLKGNYHAERGYIYFRSVDGMLLIGGGRHWLAEEEKGDEMRVNEELKSRLTQWAKENLFSRDTQLEEVMSWSGIIGTGSEKYPLLEWKDKNVLAAVRLSGMGVALSPVIARKAAVMLLQNR